VAALNAKSLTIGGALVLLAVTLIGRFEGLVTDQMLIWAAMIVGMAVASYAFSIGATEYYKRRTFSQKQIECINDPHSTGCDKEKRKTHDFAVRSAFLGMVACGVIFVLLEGADWRLAIVIAVFWSFLSAIVGVTAPLVYRLLRKRFLTVAGENEAMDRPSEVPRD
jgi:RsiW-degrading membrane proteinase PrsW (M82 family)